nr:MAG TPA: hypothetical protein [Bacteriophage sp.]
MIYYITLKDGTKKLVAYEYKRYFVLNNGNFHVCPEFKNMKIDADAETITIDGEEYEIEQEDDMKRNLADYSNEELAFMISCQDEWEQDFVEELMERAKYENEDLLYEKALEVIEDKEKVIDAAVNENWERMYEEAAEILGVEI